MRFVLVLAFAAVAYAGTLPSYNGAIGRPVSADVDQQVMDLMENVEVEYAADPEDGTVEADPRYIVSWQIRRAIRKAQKQMPCGWPQYGIPPLAPLKKTDLNIHMQKGIVETIDHLFRFRIDGLDNFLIKKFKLNMITSKITFDFLFKNIKTSAQNYDTDTILDAMRQLGLSVQYEGDGTLDFGLKNLRVAGVLRYKLPVLWGSAKITSLKTTITLEDCESQISGFGGDGKINRMVNRQVENFVVSMINNNQQEISDMIENNLVPRVNKMLKGKDFWTLIDIIFSSNENEQEDDPIVTQCVPPTDPWA